MKLAVRHCALFAAATIAIAACASDAPLRAAPDEGRSDGALAPRIAERVYVQLDGLGETPEDEFRPNDEERYLDILVESLEAEVFGDAERWSDEAPPAALVVDVDIEAQIDAERSWSNAALLMVIPVKTRGSVDVEFTLKRADRVLLTRRYNETVETFAVPAAELAGRTWVAASGALERAVGRFATDIDDRTARRLVGRKPVAEIVSRRFVEFDQGS